MSPELRPKSLGTFEKRAPGLFAFAKTSHSLAFYMTSVEGYTAPYKIKMHPTTINNISLVDIFGLILGLKSQFANTKLFAPTFICAGFSKSSARCCRKRIGCDEHGEH